MKGTQINLIKSYEHGIRLSNQKARFYDFTDFIKDTTSSPDSNESDPTVTKPVAHFYGGNGFPVGVYQPLITELSQHLNITSLAMRGYWFDEPSDHVLTREGDANVLIEFLEKTQDKPVIGIGHSQGATATAMAAAKRPDLFSKLFLIDPVTFTRAQTILFNLIPHALLMTQEPFKSTHNKKADWQSVDEYYQYLRQHRAFKRISDTNLRIFAQNSLVPKFNTHKKYGDNYGYTLLFKPKQELASYFGTPYIDPALRELTRLNLPFHLILAKPSMFNSNKVRNRWQKFVPQENVTVCSNYGHLLPMEAPKECADIIASLPLR